MFPVDSRSPYRIHFKGVLVVGQRPRRWVPRCGMWCAVKKGCKLFNVWYDPRRGARCTDMFILDNGQVREVHYFPFGGFDVKKRQVGAKPGNSTHQHLAPMESNVFTKLEQIVAHCAVTRYDDGEPRTPGWVVIKTLGSAWVIEAKDPDACARMTATGDTLDNALALLDMLLGSEEAPWEADPWLKRRGGTGKKSS